MFFMIREIEVPEAPFIEPAIRFGWTLHRKDKDAEDQLGEAICRSVDSWPTERQCRAAINTAKKSMQGVRFAQTRMASP